MAASYHLHIPLGITPACRASPILRAQHADVSKSKDDAANGPVPPKLYPLMIAGAEPGSQTVPGLDQHIYQQLAATRTLQGRLVSHLRHHDAA